MDFEDISSTNIRQSIKEGKNIDKYVTDKVKGYIKENGLYQN